MDIKANDDKKTEQTAELPPPVRIGFMKDRPATLLIQLDLDRMGRPTARGHLLQCDEIVNQWYAERDKLRDKLSLRDKIKGGMAAITRLARGG